MERDFYPVTTEHVPVLLSEALYAMRLQPGDKVVDATYGRGGHSAAILEAIGPHGHLLALDQDPDAIQSGRQRWENEPRLTLEHASFARLLEVARGTGLESVDAILFDLGISSPQVDNGARGFSFRLDGVLDMRMNPHDNNTETAAQWLNRAGIREIATVLKEYGDEFNAFRIAKKIVKARQTQGFSRTGELAALIRTCVHSREKGNDAATRSFQAIRIHINQELDALKSALPQAMALLKSGGRLTVISFHSLEDRITKRFIRAATHPDTTSPRLPLRHDQLPQPLLVSGGKPLRPSREECARNPRARSAILRYAVKC